MIARRVSSDQSNDPLLTSSGLHTAVLGSASRERVSFPLYDGHGNTIATLARNGTGYSIANVKRYDVWGEVRSDSSVGSSGQVLNPTQKYCGNLGHKYDATSGLTYMRARYYEAETGRFISEDPAHEGANWYAYCKNNPAGGVDSEGKSSESDQLTNNASKWIQAFGGLAMILAGAHGSTAAQVVAASQLAFLIVWFTADFRSSVGEDYTMRLLGGGLMAAMVSMVAECAVMRPKPTDASPLSHMLGLVAVHGGFLLTFMALEDIASGY